MPEVIKMLISRRCHHCFVCAYRLSGLSQGSVLESVTFMSRSWINTFRQDTALCTLFPVCVCLKHNKLTSNKTFTVLPGRAACEHIIIIAIFFLLPLKLERRQVYLTAAVSENSFSWSVFSACTPRGIVLLHSVICLVDLSSCHTLHSLWHEHFHLWGSMQHG